MPLFVTAARTGFADERSRRPNFAFLAQLLVDTGGKGRIV